MKSIPRAIAAALAAAAFAVSAQTGPVKFAGIMELSGSGATPGTNFNNGVKLAVKEINASGGILGRQIGVNQAAVQAARQAVEITLNEYQAGTVAYTTVITAQVTLLTDQETALLVQENRLIASVALIEALGGGWDASQLPDGHELQRPHLIPD